MSYSHLYSQLNSLIKVFPIPIFLHPTVYVFTLRSQIRGLVVGVVLCTKYRQPGPHSWQGCGDEEREREREGAITNIE